MVTVDWTILVQIANFLVLIFVLNLVLYKPIRNILRQRKAKVEGLADRISSTAKEAEDKNQAFSDGLKTARAKGQKEKEALVLKATEEERSIIDDINTKARADMDAVKTQIAKDAGAVKQELEKEIDTFADTISQKILGRAA